MELIKLAGIGVVLGAITVIPGVSTGTIAVVLNIYDRLIEIITPNIKKIIAAWKFWLPLVIGIAVGAVLFSKLVILLFDNYPVPTYWFFIGIILGSIPMIYRRVPGPGVKLPSLSAVISCVIALAVLVVTVVVNPTEETAPYTVLTPPLFGMLLAGGFLSAIAMIIPGISGTILLLIIGLYRTVVQAVSVINIPLLVPVILGAVIGLVIGAAIVRFLLEKVPGETYGAILGLVVGSVVAVYPGSLGNGAEIAFSIICVIAGIAVSYFFGKTTTHQPTPPQSG